MESLGQAGSIQVSDSTYERLKDRYRFDGSRSLEIKGRGTELVHVLCARLSTPVGLRYVSPAPAPGPAQIMGCEIPIYIQRRPQWKQNLEATKEKMVEYERCH